MPTSRQTEKCDRSVAQSTHCSYGAVSADPEAKAYFHAKMVFGESVRLVPLRGDAMMFRVVPGAQELLPGHRVVVRIVAGLFGSELLVQRRTFGRRGEAYRLLRKWRTRGYLFNDAADVQPYMCSMS